MFVIKYLLRPYVIGSVAQIQDFFLFIHIRKTKKAGTQSDPGLSNDIRFLFHFVFKRLCHFKMVFQSGHFTCCP